MKVSKIEDVFGKVNQTIKFPATTEPDLSIPVTKDQLSFSKFLDFTFPKTVDGGKTSQVGEIIYVGDGVVHIAGLDKAMIEELVEIDTNSGIQRAMILGVQETRVEAVVMGEYSKIKRGDRARSTGSKLTVPTGPSLLGRVINPLGQPIDGKGPINSSSIREVEFPAPGVMDRYPIFEPLNTGILVIDTTIPIGKGQRELVIGDRKTGKSRTMLDIIANQQGNNVYCVYVGVGIQAAKAKATLQYLVKRGAMKYTIFVASLANDPPSLQYISPYVGAALAEHFMYQGKDALVVYDDLSKQAKAYRQVSLLLKRSPGRDAYPGDIFFLHSRLLERASKVSKDLGFGSITALPVAETQAGDVSDYIITNLMSITDGHIFLDANLMHEGVLPAVNSGLSVSRIGGKVQTPLLRKAGELAGRALARYGEVKSFETINTEVSDDTLRDIRRGKRVKEILGQDSTFNYTNDEQVVILAIATSSRMDHLELEHSITFKNNIIPFYRKLKMDKLKELCKSAKDMAEIDSYLDEIFHKFCQEFKLPILEIQTSK